MCYECFRKSSQSASVNVVLAYSVSKRRFSYENQIASVVIFVRNKHSFHSLLVSVFEYRGFHRYSLHKAEALAQVSFTEYAMRRLAYFHSLPGNYDDSHASSASVDWSELVGSESQLWFVQGLFLDTNRRLRRKHVGVR